MEANTPKINEGMAQWLRAPAALSEDPSSDPTWEGSQAPVSIADFMLFGL